MAYAVARKTNEIGIRMALGAERGAILGMVLRETAAIVLAGIAVGVPAAWIASNLLKTRLFGLTPHDPWSIGLVRGGNFAGNDACRLHPSQKGIKSGSDGGIAVRMRDNAQRSRIN